MARAYPPVAARVAAVILERSMHEQFLSNTYLVVDAPGGAAVLVDAGGPVEPLLARLDDLRARLELVLLTHSHFDHVSELDAVLDRHPHARALAHELEGLEAAEAIAPGDAVEAGSVRTRALHTPGHTAGMLSFVVDGVGVFTGDTLFKGSVGGVRAPGHTTFEDLRTSIMDGLMRLPPDTAVHPGHTEATTVRAEWEGNPFVRVWRGLEPEGSEPCVALGEAATLVLLAPDYDGGHKAWVRWPDGRDDIVPGSQVERPGA
jgi:glyoxylase-like metal-dependent hydrolase (beta-lactamase superfamily II)